MEGFAKLDGVLSCSNPGFDGWVSCWGGLVNFLWLEGGGWR